MPATDAPTGNGMGLGSVPGLFRSLADDLTRLDDVSAVGERWFDPTWVNRSTPPQR